MSGNLLIPALVFDVPSRKLGTSKRIVAKLREQEYLINDPRMLGLTLVTGSANLLLSLGRLSQIHGTGSRLRTIRSSGLSVFLSGLPV